MLQASRDNIAHFAHLGGLVFGYIFMKWKFRLPLPYALVERFRLSLKRRLLWRKARQQRYKPIDAEEFISQEVDPILAKISRYGIGSLTRRERRILKKARAAMK